MVHLGFCFAEFGANYVRHRANLRAKSIHYNIIDLAQTEFKDLLNRFDHR